VLSKLVVGFPGTGSPLILNPLSRCVENGALGGVILFGHNIVDFQQLKTLTNHLKSVGVPWIGIDQEGGKVQRLVSSKGFLETPSAYDLAQKSPEEIYNAYALLGKQLFDCGIDVNFAPVVDLHCPSNPIIGQFGRSFGSLKEVLGCCEIAIKAHLDQGVQPCIKHFPGHGYSHSDSHGGFVDITKTSHHDELAAFHLLIKKYPEIMVMSGHLYHKDRDPLWPASLSPWTGETLKSWGHKGPLITDDLSMGALQSWAVDIRMDQAQQNGHSYLMFGCNEGLMGGESIVEEEYDDWLKILENHLNRVHCF
jgi:beta-N-acetylhexosaminidase